MVEDFIRVLVEPKENYQIIYEGAQSVQLASNEFSL